MDDTQTSLNRSSKIFFSIFFAVILISIGVTYYESVVRENYVTFTDAENVPDAADFFAYLIDGISSYLQK